MTELLPRRSEVDVDDRAPRVIEFDDEAAHTVLSVLSTRTARTLFAELYREPTTLSTLADRADTSIQNATYHLRRLEDSELVEVVDAWYSARGREMDVYAPTNEPLVLVASTGEDDTDSPHRIPSW